MGRIRTCMMKLLLNWVWLMPLPSPSMGELLRTGGRWDTCCKKLVSPMLNETERMCAFGEPMCSPNASVLFIATPRQYDRAAVLEMFKTENAGYLVANCRMIMVSSTVDSLWGLYAMYMKRKILNVLDPTYTDKEEDANQSKHGDNARHVLDGISAVGRELGDGWVINTDDWGNIGTHETCASEDSGPSVHVLSTRQGTSTVMIRRN